MAKDTSKYVVDESSQLVDGVADLDREQHAWPDGRPMTEENTAEYSDKLAGEPNAPGRPSLSGGGSTPQVAFRLPANVRERAESVAAEEGRTVSAIARTALEEYLERHSA
jgi:hypothetical protein